MSSRSHAANAELFLIIAVNMFFDELFIENDIIARDGQAPTEVSCDVSGVAIITHLYQ